MEHQHLAGARHRLANRVSVEREEGPQVEHLYGYAVRLLYCIGCFERPVYADAVGNHAEVRATPLDVRPADGNQIFLGGDLAFPTTIALLMLEKEHGVVVPHRAFEQPFTVVRRGRDDDFEPRHMVEERFHALRMVEPAVHSGAKRGADHDRTAEHSVGSIAY